MTFFVSPIEQAKESFAACTVNAEHDWRYVSPDQFRGAGLPGDRFQYGCAACGVRFTGVMREEVTIAGQKVRVVDAKDFEFHREPR